MMLSVFSYQGISASPACQHSDRREAVDVAFPCVWRNQFLSQIVASPEGVGDLSQISSGRPYRTLLWIGFDKLNTKWEVVSIS